MATDYQKLLATMRRMANCSVAISWNILLSRKEAGQQAINACLALALYLELPTTTMLKEVIAPNIVWALDLYYAKDGTRYNTPSIGAVRTFHDSNVPTV